MHFVTGQAVIESSLCVISHAIVEIAISSCNSVMCILLKNETAKTTLRIHYHQISYLSICKKFVSTFECFCDLMHRFLSLRFYSKYNTKIKLTIQVSHKDGLVIANLLYQYFKKIPEVTSCIY